MSAQKSLAKRFRSYVNTMPTPTGCHLWMGGTGGGYGLFWVKDKTVQATHFAWYLKTGKWPKDKILHCCDTPPCVRYEHLFEGSQADNIHDMMQKGRQREMRGEQHPGAKLTWEKVHWIRDRYSKSLLNQYELAEQCNVSQSTIYNIVSNRRWKLQPVAITSTGNATGTSQ